MSAEIKKLRSEILKKRNGLPLDFRKREESEINRIILKHDKIREADVIAVFAPYKSAIDIWESIQGLWQKGKVLAFPKVTGKEMQFFKCHSEQDLVEGYKGILEPKAEAEWVSPSSIDCLIAPGSVFSLEGQRIGYGGGFYDKYLSDPTFSAYTMGVGFSFQVCEPWVSEPWDVTMDAVLNIWENNTV